VAPRHRDAKARHERLSSRRRLAFRSYKPPHTIKMPVKFRARQLDVGGFVNKWIIRDHTKRKVYAEYEPERQALRYIIRNTTLPQRMRAAAQIQLAQMHCYTRSTQINNRCQGGGRVRGVFRDFRLARVSFSLSFYKLVNCSHLTVSIPNGSSRRSITWCT
jgi:small subunit ribosomal protein S14